MISRVMAIRSTVTGSVVSDQLMRSLSDHEESIARQMKQYTFKKYLLFSSLVAGLVWIDLSPATGREEFLGGDAAVCH